LIIIDRELGASNSASVFARKEHDTCCDIIRRAEMSWRNALPLPFRAFTASRIHVNQRLTNCVKWHALR
jgi:hypothetical protein